MARCIKAHIFYSKFQYDNSQHYLPYGRQGEKTFARVDGKEVECTEIICIRCDGPDLNSTLGDKDGNVDPAFVKRNVETHKSLYKDTVYLGIGRFVRHGKK